METVSKLSITQVGCESVEKDDSFPAAIAFYVELSAVPDSVWREFFTSEYEQTWFNLKREVTLRGNKIRIVCAPGEEQKQVDFVKRIVEGANQKVEDYNTELGREEKFEQQQRKQETTMVEEAKQRLKKVTL